MVQCEIDGCNTVRYKVGRHKAVRHKMDGSDVVEHEWAMVECIKERQSSLNTIDVWYEIGEQALNMHKRVHRIDVGAKVMVGHI